mmetsp:Transcript_54692/g.158870  ORF Transcript_54692/g.158870 Transcript_54692/m.158870 type:complete len:326 (-) Transcript_54692:168-1145(-)
MCLAGLTEVRQAAKEQEAGKAAAAAVPEASGLEAAGIFDKILAQQRCGVVELPQKVQQAPFTENANGVEASQQCSFNEPPPQPETAAEARGTTAPTDTSRLQKTKMCKFFAAGQCTRGEACSFAHSKKQLRPQPNLFRTRVCLDFASGGGCAFGDKCKYAHSEQEVRPDNVMKPIKHAGAGKRRGDRPNPPAAHLDLAKELEEVKRQSEQLRAQLQALQSQVAVEPPTLEKLSGSQRSTSPSDAAGGSSSRRGRSPGPSPSGLASTICSEDGAKLERKASTSSWSDTIDMEEEEVQQEVEVSVKNTFFHLAPRRGSLALRRSRST